jgi:hypothetical protein
MNISKRLDAPAEAQCVTNANCPAVFLLDTGDIAMIARVAPEHLELPPGTGVGPGETLVVMPRSVIESTGWAVGS